MNAIMNKTSTGKLLAAVLVMVMVIAGAAVVLSDSVSADGETGELQFSADSYIEEAADGSLSGAVGIASSTDVVVDGASNNTFGYFFPDVSGYGYAILDIAIPAGSTIVQKNSALEACAADTENITNDGGVWTKTKTYESADSGYIFLIPKEGDRTVTITVTNGTDIKEYKYDFSDVQTLSVVTASDGIISLTGDSLLDVGEPASYNAYYDQQRSYVVSSNLTVNLNGYTLYANGIAFTLNSTGIDLVINGENGGSIVAKSAVVYNNYMDGNDLTINGGTYEGSRIINFMGATGESVSSLTISGATLNGTQGVWFGNGITDTVNISNTVINADTVGIYLGVVGTVNLNNVDITVGNTDGSFGVEVKSGTVTFIGGSISGGDYIEADGTINQNGSGTGAATLNINNGYQRIANAAGNVSVTIKGTSLESSVSDILVQICAGVYSDSNNCPGNIAFTSDGSLSMDQIAIVQHSVEASDNRTIDVEISGQKTTTVTDDSGIANALKDEEVDCIIYTGNSIGTSASVELTKPVTFTNLDNGNNQVTVTDDGPITIDGTVGKLTVTISAATGETGNNTATITNVAGNFTITVGSIAIEGQADIPDGTTSGTIEVNGVAEVVNSFTVGEGVTLNVTGGTFEVPAGTILNINGNMTIAAGVKVTNNGTINVTGKITNNGEITNNGQIYTSSNDNITGTGTVKGNSVTEGLGLSNNMDAIASDLPLSGYAYLTSDLTIPAGKSISVNAGATLDLRGYTLTVLGTLNVASNGTVINAGSTGGIVIGTNGVINNSGILGSTNAPVTVSLADGEDGSVTLANVNGLSFGYKRVVVGTNNVDYYLAISGDATKRGQDNGSITVSGTVYVNDALTVGSKVDMTIDGKLVLDNGVRFTVSSSGTASGSGSVVLGVGSVVDIDGYADITVSAPTGDFRASNGTAPGTSSIDIANVKGIEITVTSESYSDNGVLMMKQRLDISGAMDDADAKKGDATVEFTGDHITVTGTLTVNKDIKSWTNSGTITVTGTISYDSEIDVSSDIVTGDIVGAFYQIQTTVEGVPSLTNYITSFQAAIENIANAYEQTVTAYGTVDVDFDFTIGADQTVEGNATYNIDKDATVTVANDGYFEASAVSVEGRLVVYVNGVIQFTPEYSVKSVDAEYTTTYSGFAAALEDAQPGQTITVEKNTYVDESVTIPEGVTVVVSNGAVLGIGYDSDGNTADNTADLTVNGTLNVIGSVNVNGDVDVAGTADLTEATDFNITDADGEITVTGTLTAFGTTIIDDTMKVNAFKYTNLDQETVYTNLAAAAEVVNGYDVNKVIDQVGTVSDSAAVTLTGVTLNINGTARLGTVTLDESRIVVDGTLTATVAGLSGEEGSTVETSVALTAVKNVTVVNTVVPNDANVDVHTTSIALTSNATSDKLVGAVSVDTGVLTIADTITVAGDKNTLTVASGAEAVIANGNTLTAGEGENHAASVTVDGTMTVNGTLKVTGVMDVNGTLDVAKAKKGDAAKLTIDAPVANTSCGTLNIAGDLNISGEQDLRGEAEINGVLAVSGTVTGAVKTIGDNGYIKAYAGSDMTGAELMVSESTGESGAVSTGFNINGALYMTVYVVDGTDVTYDNVLTAEEFSVPGYDVSDLGALWTEPAQGQQAVAVWYKDADLTQAVATNNDADTAELGADENVYAKVSALNVEVRVSVGTGISLYIDDIRITDNTVTLSVGTHTVSAVVDPGYTGTVSISFNGAAVNGSFEITSDMASAAYEGTPAISATGNISVDGGSSSGTTTSGDDGMGLTDYLLIILVILIVIMAIIVALRLMRS